MDKAYKHSILNRIKIALDIHISIKNNIVLHVILVDDDTKRTESFSIRLENESLYKESNLKKYLRKQTQILVPRSEEFFYDKYKMRIKEIVGLDMNINKLNPIKGGSYIELPDWIMRKKAIINAKNKDEKVLCGLC